MRMPIWFIIVFFTTTSIAVAKSTLRCPNGIVQTWDTQVVVKQKCGEPFAKQKIAHKFYPGTSTNSVSGDDVEEWYYEIHYGFNDVLTFKGGKLAIIEMIRK